MKTEPLRTVLIPVVLAAFAAAAQAFIDGATTRGIITAALGALVLAAQELARRYVTPTGRTDERGQAEPLMLLVYALVIVILVVLIVYLVRHLD